MSNPVSRSPGSRRLDEIGAQLFHRTTLYGFPQADHAPVVELAEGHQQQGEEQHAPDPADAPAHIQGQEGGQGVQADLIPQELGLDAAAHQADRAPGDQQAQAPGQIPQQQTALYESGFRMATIPSQRMSSFTNSPYGPSHASCLL